MSLSIMKSWCTTAKNIKPKLRSQSNGGLKLKGETLKKKNLIDTEKVNIEEMPVGRKVVWQWSNQIKSKSEFI